MPGETDLGRLIAGMTPRLDPATYVFATLPHDHAMPPDLRPLMTFREAEGVTLVLPQEAARGTGIETIFPCRRITLEVHSSLEAVGLMAAVATCLAEAGIGTNPVAGYFHDHLFVPANRAEEALARLRALAASGR